MVKILRAHHQRVAFHFCHNMIHFCFIQFILFIFIVNDSVLFLDNFGIEVTNFYSNLCYHLSVTVNKSSAVNKYFEMYYKWLHALLEAPENCQFQHTTHFFFPLIKKRTYNHHK